MCCPVDVEPRQHLQKACVVAGWVGFTLPIAAVKGCTFAEFNYALEALQNAQRTKRAQTAKQSSQAHRSQGEAELRSAFTREEAAAGCSDIDDEDTGDAGEL